MSATITEAPSSTKRRTVASPMPLEPPVISATLPLSRVMPSSVLGEPHGARHGLEMVRRVAEVEGGGHDALVKEMQRVLLAEADGAQELVRLARDGLRGAARVGLGHRDLGRSVPARVDRRGCAVDEAARRLYVAQEIGAGVLDGLERSERTPELLAPLRVLHGDVEDALGATHHLGGARESAGLERRAERVPSTSRSAEEILRPQLHACEVDLAGTVTRHGFHGEHGDARSPCIEEEEAQAGGITRGHDQLIGDVRVVHEELAAGEPAARLAREHDGLAVDRGTLLGESEDADALAASQRRQVSLALRGAAAGRDEGSGHHRALHVRAREARAPHLLEEERHVQHVAAAASVLLGDEETGPAQDGDFLPELCGEATLARHTLRHGTG